MNSVSKANLEEKATELKKIFQSEHEKALKNWFIHYFVTRASKENNQLPLYSSLIQAIKVSAFTQETQREVTNSIKKLLCSEELFI
jgi:hypothetical protein